jgi:RNA polymerase sigma-70 factor (ECF subfamily)
MYALFAKKRGQGHLFSWKGAKRRRIPSGLPRTGRIDRAWLLTRAQGPAYTQRSMADPPSPAQITRILEEWQSGSQEALDRLIPLVYNELHALASRQLAREWRHHRLQTTVVVNEAYMKLFGQREVDWQNRGHFFAIAAQLMRRILVDHARREQREKRGGDVVHVGLDDPAAAAAAAPVDAVDTLALDRALQKLEQIDPDQARIVELRFFGGLTVEETAAVVGVSPTTVKREWALAKAWLYLELGGDSSTGQA